CSRIHSQWQQRTSPSRRDQVCAKPRLVYRGQQSLNPRLSIYNLPVYSRPHRGHINFPG
ncbi:hypothetical protein THAOC_31513, partial [Thalassiosira oceanica]